MFEQKKIAIENAAERLSRQIGEVANAQGFSIDITTLTDIKARVTDQKFYEVRPSDYMPVVVGENMWADDLLTYKTFSLGGDFEKSIVDPRTNNGKLQSSDTAVEGVKVPTKFWGEEIHYNLIELNRATKSGNWSLIEAKEKARMKGWQLGIQKTAFLGLSSDTNVEGLLNQSGVNANTTLITKDIKDMTSTEFETMISGLLPAYYANSNATVLPDTFVIPSDDFQGLGAASDPSFPLKSKLERLQDSLRIITANPNFEVKPLAYAQEESNGLGKNVYVLYNRNDEESLRMDVPIDYTTTLTDTVNGMNYTSTAYGQFTGAFAYRPLEMLYFEYSND